MFSGPELIVTLSNSEMPNKPCSIIGTDIFQIREDQFLIIADYYSKFLLVEKLPVAGSEPNKFHHLMCNMSGFSSLIPLIPTKFPRKSQHSFVGCLVYSRKFQQDPNINFNTGLYRKFYKSKSGFGYFLTWSQHNNYPTNSSINMTKSSICARQNQTCSAKSCIFCPAKTSTCPAKKQENPAWSLHFKFFKLKKHMDAIKHACCNLYML